MLMHACRVGRFLVPGFLSWRLRKSLRGAREHITPTKSPQDDRSYRVVRLSNHMQVLLVSDPTCDKSGAALDVNVGHLMDPKECQGLAHFLEHMMHLGGCLLAILPCPALPCAALTCLPACLPACGYHLLFRASSLPFRRCTTLVSGSEKFPMEDAYKKWLSKHSGPSNASTNTTNTKYMYMHFLDMI